VLLNKEVDRALLHSPLAYKWWNR